MALDMAAFPFDAGAGSGIASEDQWERLFDALQLDGVVAGYPAAVTPITTELQVYGDSTGMQCKVRAGAAYLKGRSGYRSAEGTLTISTADATNPRWDMVVARLERSANTGVIDVLTGTPAASPAEPALTRNATIHEIPLARVVVGAGVTTIAAANVVERRQWAIPNSKGLPLARVTRGADQTISTATRTAVTWTSTIFDTGQFVAAATPTRLTCVRDGIYEFTAGVRMAANATGVRQYEIQKNGPIVLAVEWEIGSSAIESARSLASGPVDMAAGDYVELYVTQTSGGNLALQAANQYAPVLTAKLVRATSW